MPTTLTINPYEPYNAIQWQPVHYTSPSIIDKNTYVFPFKEGDYVKRKKAAYGVKYPIGVVTDKYGFNEWDESDPYVIVNWGNVRTSPMSVKNLVKIELKEIEELL